MSCKKRRSRGSARQWHGMGRLTVRVHAQCYHNRLMRTDASRGHPSAAKRRTNCAICVQSSREMS